METGFRNILILIFTLVGTYLMPITISFAIYLALLCVKERTFKNQVNIITNSKIEETPKHFSRQIEAELTLENVEPKPIAEPQSNSSSKPVSEKIESCKQCVLKSKKDSNCVSHSLQKSRSSSSIEINPDHCDVPFQNSSIFYLKNVENKSETEVNLGGRNK